MIQNPYWEIVQLIPNDSIYGRLRGEAFRPDSYPRLRDYIEPSPYGEEREQDQKNLLRAEELLGERPNRSVLVRKFAWSITAPNVLDFIVKTLDGRSVVEMGAGTGYWAWMLTQLGVDVIAYDSDPPEKGTNSWHAEKTKQWHVYTAEERLAHYENWKLFKEVTDNLHQLSKDNPEMVPEWPDYEELPEGDWLDRPAGVSGKHESYHPILEGGPEALRNHADRVLFLSWPPYDSPMAADCLMNYEGDTLIFIGENDGGCTGDELFFEALEKHWTLVDELWTEGGFIQWSGLNDYVQIFRRNV